jgi:hypothetical protein
MHVTLQYIHQTLQYILGRIYTICERANETPKVRQTPPTTPNSTGYITYVVDFNTTRIERDRALAQHFQLIERLQAERHEESARINLLNSKPIFQIL